MSQLPVAGFIEGMSPYYIPFPRHISPDAWYPPYQHWHGRTGPPSRSFRNPHYIMTPSPNGYPGFLQQWSPIRWEPVPNYRRSWGPSPRSLQFSPSYKKSPEHGTPYSDRKDGKAQDHFKPKRGNPKHISNYYNPSMVEDPWAELQAKATGTTGSTSRHIMDFTTSGLAANMGNFLMDTIVQ